MIIICIYKEELPSSDLSKPEVTDYAIMIAIVYSMVKQDYAMQVISVHFPFIFSSFSIAVDGR